MRKMLGSIAAIGALALLSLTAGPAAASTLPAGYADTEVSVDIVLPDRLLYGGDTVEVEVHATRGGEPLVCDSLSVTFEPSGLVEEFRGGGQSDYSFTLDTEVVQQRTPTTATATCTFNPLQAQGTVAPVAGQSVSVPALSTSCGTGCVTNSSVVTLLPRDGGTADSGGFLPKTGTEIGLWLLVIGGGLVLGGTAVALVARRRSH